jgi:hypothetical protein
VLLILFRLESKEDSINVLAEDIGYDISPRQVERPLKKYIYILSRRLASSITNEAEGGRLKNGRWPNREEKEGSRG